MGEKHLDLLPELHRDVVLAGLGNVAGDLPGIFMFLAGDLARIRMRRRGVEMKLYLGDASTEVDRTLIQNIVNAQKWMAMIIQGKTFSEIAETEGRSKRRVQDVIDLAMLAPDILDAIAKGEQSEGLTSDHLIKSGVPAVWKEQHELFGKL